MELTNTKWSSRRFFVTRQRGWHEFISETSDDRLIDRHDSFNLRVKRDSIGGGLFPLLIETIEEGVIAETESSMSIDSSTTNDFKASILKSIRATEFND